MKFLLISSLIFTHSLFAFGAIGIKNLNLSYVNGAGSADFEKLHIGMGVFEVNVNELTHIDINYKNNSYVVSKRLGNSSKADFLWKLDTSTIFMQDVSNDVIIQTNKPMTVLMGTRKSLLDIPHLALATNTIALEAKNIKGHCNFKNGAHDPVDYIVNVLKACLVNSSITADSLVSRQEEQEEPLLTQDFDEILSVAKHPLAQKTGIELDNIRTTTKDKQLLDNFNFQVVNSQASLNFKIKVWQIPLTIEFQGPIRLLDKSRQIRVNIQQFKILGINFSNTLIKIIENYLKKYSSKSIKVDYPYIYLDVGYLYTSRK